MMKKTLFACALALLGATAYAACTESTQQCVIYKNGNVAAEGACTVSKCQDAAGSSMAWKLKNGKGVKVETAKNGKTTVNKKAGGQIKNGNAAGMGLTCYATDADKREQFCSTNY